MTSTSSGRKRRRPPATAARSTRSRPPPPPELRAAGLRPRKSLGQHFLTSERTLLRIADAAELTPDDVVVEIGAGLGGLTGLLAERAGRVIAVELDDALAALLRERFDGTNVSVVHADAREIDVARVLAEQDMAGPYVVTGNLPYNVAQPVLRHFLESAPRPDRLVVMVQAEVAESIAAQPGDMSLLSVSVQLYGEPTLLFRVPPSAFYPPPKVMSAVVRIGVLPELRAGVRDTEAFFRVVRAGFSTRRKQLRNALALGLSIEAPLAGELLTEAAIDPTLRPQALALEQWAALTDAWIARGRPESQR